MQAANLWRGHLRALRLLCVVTAAAASLLLAQAPPAPRLAFDIASVRQHQTSGSGAGSMQSNVPLGPGDIYTPTGGVLAIHSARLISLISFAWRMSDAQLNAFTSRAPDWMLRDRFDVEARTDRVNVSKNELRTMMQALLADRFRLAMHHEARQSAVFGLVLASPGTTGPHLRAHPADQGCSTEIPAAPPSGTTPAPDVIQTVPGGYPSVCGGIVRLDSAAPGRILIGGRAIRFSLLVDSLASWGQLDRPILDQTGLTGNFDFLLEYSPQTPVEATEAMPPGGPTFASALRQQLGLTLQAQKSTVDFLVLDHVEHPTEN